MALSEEEKEKRRKELATLASELMAKMMPHAMPKSILANIPTFVPPPKPQPPHIPSPAEALAMRVIMTALVSMLAERESAASGVTPQDWVNALCLACSESVLGATITGDAGIDVPKFRSEALDKVVEILAGASVDGNASQMN